jgi:hypothetical protein
MVGWSEGKMVGDSWRLEGLNDSGWSEGGMVGDGGLVIG